MIEFMGGEWRALPLGENRTQLIITHDFAARPTEQVPVRRDDYLDQPGCSPVLAE